MINRDIFNYLGDKIGNISFEDGTSENEINSQVAAYAAIPVVDPDSFLKFSIVDRKKFADELLEKFKLKNIKDGIGALQGLHMHHLLRAYPVSFGGESFTIDIMNLAISGDLEIACISLIYGATDDMSLPKHWMSAARKAWLITEIKAYLGWA